MPSPSPRLSGNLPAFVTGALTTSEGALYCHVPADEPVDLGALPHGGDASDRWSRADQPTVYLASDAGVVLAELGRHEHGLDGSSIRRQLRGSTSVRSTTPGIARWPWPRFWSEGC